MRREAYQIDSTKFLSEQELEKVLNKLKVLQPEQFAIFLLLNTGARASEILNLDHGSLCPVSHTLYIKGLKGSKNREIPLGEKLYELCRLHWQRNSKEPKPFNFTLRWLQYQWDKLVKNKPLKATRHTYAVNLYKKTRDIKLVQTVLGHKNIQNTMVYVDYLYQKDELRQLLTLGE